MWLCALPPGDDLEMVVVRLLREKLQAHDIPKVTSSMRLEVSDLLEHVLFSTCWGSSRKKSVAFFDV